jgi:hypothetical protein
VPLHGARTPREGYTGVDGVVVLVEPLGKASQGLQHPGGGTLQPGIAAFGRPLTYELRHILRPVPLGMVRAQRSALLDLARGALLLTSEHQPGRPARGQGVVRGFSDDRQPLPSAALSGTQALGLTEPAGLGGDEAIAPGVTPVRSKNSTSLFFQRLQPPHDVLFALNSIT